MKKSYQWVEPGRERLNLTLTLNEGQIEKVEMTSVGCLDFLLLCQKMKEKLRGPILDLLPPPGTDHSSMIWREMVARIQEEWQVPFTHPELCHCRKVTTERVDRSIVYGAHTIDEVRKRTSANTGCGTCKNDVLEMISNRLTVK